MPYYRVTGEIPRKRHVRFRRPDGGLYAEELMGEEGFASDSSLLYHAHLPTAIVKSEGLADAAADAGIVPNHPLLPRHFRTGDLPRGGDLVLGRQLLLANDDVRISFAAADAASGPARVTTSWCPEAPFTGGFLPAPRLSSSRPAATSARPGATFRSSGSSSSTPRTPSGTCAVRTAR